MKPLDVLAIGSALVEMTPRQLGVDLVHATQYEALPSGATCNFCLALARLGLKVGLVTRVGDDELGQWLLRRLNEFGVDTAAAHPVPDQYTPVSFCWMNQSGEKTFYFYRFPGHCDPMQEFAREPISDEELGRAKVFDFSEATIRAEPLRSITFDLAARARGLGLQVVYAMNYRASQWQESPEQIVAIQRRALSLADVALMNVEEAELVANEGGTSVGGAFQPRPVGVRKPLPLAGDDTPPSLPEASALLALGPKVIAVTAGAAGATVITPEVTEHVAAPEVEVRYDIGAGDTFHAGFIAGLLRGYDPIMATRIGSAAAALRISREADMKSLPHWHETLEFAENDGPTLEGAPL